MLEKNKQEASNNKKSLRQYKYVQESFNSTYIGHSLR